MHNAALLGSSLLSLQSFAIAEDDTGHHDLMPPLPFQASVHSSQFRVHGFLSSARSVPSYMNRC
jgi:hypothetical protein